MEEFVIINLDSVVYILTTYLLSCIYIKIENNFLTIKF